MCDSCRRNQGVAMSLDLLITTPMYDGKLHYQCFNGILQTVAKYGAGKVGHLANQGSFIPRLRDQLTAGFLKSGAEYMLCVDADVGWTVDDLDIAWARLKGLTLDREFVAGLYARKSMRDTRPIAALLSNEQDGMREAACVGAGFMLLHRSGIERMAERYKELSYPSDAVNPESGTIVGLWSPFCAVKTSKGTPVYFGEDFSFCQRWREMGGKIWVDPKIKLPHVGEFAYHLPEGYGC
jgi:hypothetical protein